MLHLLFLSSIKIQVDQLGLAMHVYFEISGSTKRKILIITLTLLVIGGSSHFDHKVALKAL